MRPLGVQILALAYRTGEAWNETAYSNPEFDKKLQEALSISDPEKRREVMKDVETIIQDSGMIIQPYLAEAYNHMSQKVRTTLSIQPSKWICQRSGLNRPDSARGCHFSQSGASD